MPSKSGVAEQILSLPKGGGSIKGLSEKFQPDLHTGTGNFSVPITMPPGRNGFQPELSLNYSTGSGNGPFGLGWNLSVPNVTRKTSKGIPRYRDEVDAQGNPVWHEEEDVFVLSGVEDLVHVGNGYYRPRTEGLFARIQKTRAPDGQSCWVVTAKNGVRSIYGKRADSRLFVQENGVIKIFQWLLSETEDANGNTIIYAYKRDDGADLQAVLSTHPEERNHAYNQVYLKSIAYVNYPEPGLSQEQYLWKIEFDYGEYDPAGYEIQAWSVRPDSFSSYRSGFEIRTARRCQRILIKRRLEGVAVQYELIRSYELGHQLAAWSNVSLLTEVTLRGHRAGNTESFPPLTFGYTEFDPTRRQYESFSASCTYLPTKSLSDPNYELVDLDGSGLPGVLHTGPTGHRYWRNLGNMRLTVPRPLKHFPMGVTLSEDGVQFGDMEGNGSADLLVTTAAMRGYYSNDFSGEWQQFHSYNQAPSFSLKDPNVKLVDLDGDGAIDVLATQQHHFLCIHNANHGGGLAFDQPVTIERKHDLGVFPDVFLGAPDQRARLADMSGDGLQDVVLIHDRSIMYWPNLGYGRFGTQLVMWNAPALPYRYDPKRVFLSDVNGDGLADLIYVDMNKVHLWINQNGNRWSEEIVVHGTPSVNDIDSVRVADMKGTGTQGILWSYDYSLQVGKNYKYLDFTGGVKPLLMSSIENHIGARTAISYRPSTDYYIADAAAGKPWKTTLPFPVQVVGEVVVEDVVTRNKLTTRYSYHHGYYDGKEREFRGFGRVEHFDAQEFPGDPNAVAPALTVTWFHLGNGIDLSEEYFDEAGFVDPFYVPQLATPSIAVQPDRDARRALRGNVLRTELYGMDGSPARNVPYIITEGTYRAESIYCPALGAPDNLKEIWFPHPHAARTSQYERTHEPRTNLIVTEFTSFGIAPFSVYFNQTRETRTGFGRKPNVGADLQENTLQTITETEYAELNNIGPSVDLALSYSPTYIVDRPKKTIVKDTAGEILGLSRTYFDGQAFIGLPHSTPINPTTEIARGNPTRVEVLVVTDAILAQAYGPNPPAIFNQHCGYHPDPELAGCCAVNQERRDYDSHGQIVGIIDPLGDPTAATRADQRLATIHYDRFGLFPDKVIDAASFPTTVKYDYAAIAASEVEDPNGTTMSFQYDALGRLTEMAVGKTLSNGTQVGDTLTIPTVQYKYSLQFAPPQVDPLTGNLVTEAKPIQLHTLRLEESGQPIQFNPVTGKHANVFETYEYFDGFGRAIQMRAEAEPGPLDPLLHPNSQPGDPDWIACRWVVSGWQEYNNKGDVAKKYQPRYSATPAYQSEMLDSRLRATSAIQYYFDPVGRVNKIINPDGALATVGFSPWEVVAADPNDNGDQISDTDPRYGHNVGGLDVKQKYAAHIHTPRVELYDAWSRLVATREDNGWWDQAGGQVPEGTPGAIRQLYTTRHEFDLLGRLLRIFDARNLSWAPAEISAGLANPIEVGQPRPTFVHIFDLAGNKLQINHTTAAGLRCYGFDAAKNQVWSRDARGIVVTSEYDMLNRPLAVHEGQGAGRKRREHYSYRSFALADSFGRDHHLFGPAEAIRDQAGKVTFTYEFHGQVATKTRWLWADDWQDWQTPNSDFWNKDAPGFDRDVPETNSRGLANIAGYPNGLTVAYEYDTQGRVTAIVYPDDTRVTHTYNEGNLLEKIEVYNNGATSVTDAVVKNINYREDGQRFQVHFGNNVTTEYSFDPVTQRLQRIRAKQTSGTTIQDLEYFYDPAGNIVQISDRMADQVIDGVQFVTNTRRFEYDPLYRLTRAEGRMHLDALAVPCRNHEFVAPLHPLQNPSHIQNLYQDYDFCYRYDPAGHFLRNDEYMPSASIQYQSTRPDRFDGAGIEVGDYEYDANGNMVHSPCHALLEWDYEERLASSIETAPVAVLAAPPLLRYLYDAAGTRVLKVSKSHRCVVYADNVFELLIEQQNGQLSLHRREHILDGDQRVALYDESNYGAANSPLYYHGDHLGSTNAVSSGDGRFVDQESYFAFGLASDRRLVATDNRLFNAKTLDHESGLYYFGSRYYDPRIGRFVSPDRLMLGLSAEGLDLSVTSRSLSTLRSSLAHNLYAFAHDSPLVARDVDGQLWFIPVILGVLIGVAIDLAAQKFIEKKTFSRSAPPEQQISWKSLVVSGVAGGLTGGAGSWIAKGTWRLIAANIDVGIGTRLATGLWEGEQPVSQVLEEATDIPQMALDAVTGKFGRWRSCLGPTGKKIMQQARNIQNLKSRRGIPHKKNMIEGLERAIKKNQVKEALELSPFSMGQSTTETLRLMQLRGSQPLVTSESSAAQPKSGEDVFIMHEAPSGDRDRSHRGPDNITLFKWQ